MTVSTSYSPLSYNGNDATTEFAVSWPFFDESHLVVTLISSAGVETVKTITTHYTVSGGADSDGLPSTGTVTMLTAPASGETLRITRATPKTQATVFNKNAAFPAKSLEALADRLTLITQETGGGGFDDITGDTIQFVSSGADPDYWDAESHLLSNLADPVSAQDAATLAYGEANWGGTAADAAAASAAAALVSENNAATSETNAAASWDQFDDIYLGQKASNPSVDNDGDALQTGAMYFNTTDDEMKVYNGASWQVVSPYPITTVDGQVGAVVVNAVKNYATRTALKAVDTDDITIAYLSEAGREGIFVWTTGDYSTEVAADTNEGLYIKADAVAATSGAWIRSGNGPISITWYGAVADGATDNSSAIQAAIDDSEATGRALYIPGSPQSSGGNAAPYQFATTLTSNGRINIYGDGVWESVLEYTGAGNAITITTTTWAASYTLLPSTAFRNFTVQHSTPGSGLVGIHVIVASGKPYSNFVWDHVKVGVFGTVSVYLDNTAGATDGFFIGQFTNCSFSGGFLGRKIGDTLQWDMCRVHDVGGYGVDITGVVGARELVWQNCSITCTSGMRFEDANGIRILNCHIEESINFDGITGLLEFDNCTEITILGCRVSTLAATKATYTVFLDGTTTAVTIDECEFSQGTSQHIFSGASTSDVFVGYRNNQDEASLAVTLTGATSAYLNRHQTNAVLQTGATGTAKFDATPRFDALGLGVDPVRLFDITEADDVAIGRLNSTHTTLANPLFYFDATRAANSAYAFAHFRSSAGADLEFKFSGDGNGTCDGAWTGGGADYAEWMETATGQDIPVGKTVVLDGGKVREATPADNPSDIIGVVRPQGDAQSMAIVGNHREFQWRGKYLTDDYGVYLQEPYTAVEWRDMIRHVRWVDRRVPNRPIEKDFIVADLPEGFVIPDDAEYYEVEGPDTRSFEKDRVPADVVVPAHARDVTTDTNGNPLMRRVLNPAFDPAIEYVPGSKRPEWVIVGLLGQVPIDATAPINPAWRPLRRISDRVVSYFVYPSAGGQGGGNAEVQQLRGEIDRIKALLVSIGTAAERNGGEP